VLAFRFVILAALAGICLWGLFSLLENLGKPELLRSPKATVVKGCAPIETAEAAELCPQFFCQKTLLDANVVPRSSKFRVTVQRRSNQTELVAGLITAGPATNQHFACVLENHQVTQHAVISAERLEALATSSGEWSL
jgi:hypothetical protein